MNERRHGRDNIADDRICGQNTWMRYFLEKYATKNESLRI